MEKGKKQISKKQKIIIAVAAVCIVGAGIVTGIILHNPLKLQKEELTVEFGQPISTEAKTYLKKDVDKDIIKNTKVEYKKNLVEGKDYDQVGDYTIKLKYKNKEKEVKVSVKDTTAPEFNATASAGIETIEGVDLKFNELITASDLSGAEVTFNADNVDLTKAGTYTLSAVAKDKYGNKAEKDIKVTVKEKPANMSGSSVSVDSKTGKVTIKAKTYSSSKSSGSTGSSKKSSSSNSSNKSSSGSSSSKGSGSSSSSSGSSGGSSGYIPGSGHKYEDSGWEDWDGSWD